MGVCEYGPDVLFVYQCNVVFGLAECCVGECLEDNEAGFCLCVYVFAVWVGNNFLSYVTPREVAVLV